MNAKKILLVTAHPDDESICSGTLIKARKNGAEIFQIVLTSAGEGRDRRAGVRDDYKKTASKRHEEMDVVAKALGISQVFFFDQEDLGLTYSKELMIEVMKVIREVAPDTVILMNQTDDHPDHKAAFQIGLQATKWAATGIRPEAGTPIRVKTVVQMGGMWGTRADFIVDVTEEVDEKIAALRLHGSQADDKMVKFDMAMMTIYGYHLRKGDGKYGEPFEFCPEYPSIDLIE